MLFHNRYVRALAGVLALAAGCASAQHPADRATAADDQARRNLEQAQEDQQRAADQQKNVAAARHEVVKAQQQLAQAQRKEGEERAKLRDIQQQGNMHLRQAEQRPVAAGGALAQPGDVAPQGQQTISGHVLQARPNLLVLQAGNGQTVTLDVNDQTQVFVGGERRSAADLQQGADARVAYENATGRPTAVTVEIPRAASGAPAPASRTAAPPAGNPPAPAPGTQAVPMPGSADAPRGETQ